MGKENIYNPLDPRISTLGHQTPEIIQKRYSDKWERYTSFVVVRNTWDRALSFFTFYRKVLQSESYQAISFDEWVAKGCPAPDESHHRSPMHSWGIFDNPLCQLQYINGVDEIIKLHSFDPAIRHQELCSGLTRISSLMGFSLKPIPSDANSSGRSDIPHLWKKDTVERIRELYKEEINHLQFLPPALS